MPHAIYEILTQDHYKHLTRAIAFVQEKNIASIKGFYRVGFNPYIIRQEEWFLFKRKISFLPIPEDFKDLVSIKVS